MPAQIQKSHHFYAILEEKTDSYMYPIRKTPVTLEIGLWEAKNLWQIIVTKRKKDQKKKREIILLQSLY